MSPDSPSERPADPEQAHGSFAAGEAHPDQYSDEDHIGRFSEGQEELGEEDPEKHVLSRFSEGQEELGEEDPEKHVQGRFSEGQEELDEPRRDVP